MKQSSHAFICLFTALLLTGCTSLRVSKATQTTNQLTALQQAMTGSYDSSSQASADPEYFNILLHMEPIWTDSDAFYLYVEQAVATDRENPYRQRVYKLEQQGRKLVSRVFELPEPERFIGAYASPESFNSIGPEMLVEKVGCEVYLKMDKYGVYRGQTKKRSCKSSLRGAAYATSRVSINNSFVQSWDRGFNENGEQVWGAKSGGYLFFKQVQ